MAFTLVSVGTMDRGGWSLLVKGGRCVIRSPKNNVIGEIPLVRGLYRIHETQISTESHITMTVSRTMSINELHRKMGHVNYKDLRRMVKQDMVTGIDLDLNSRAEFCEACIKAKAT